MNKMLIIFFYCLYFNSITPTNADYMPNITLNLYETVKGSTTYLDCNASEVYTLMDNETAEVFVMYDKSIYGDCHYAYNALDHKYLTGKFDVDDNNRNIQKSKFLVKYNTHNYQWNCTFTVERDLNETGSEFWSKKSMNTLCCFKVHVRQIKSPITTMVNNITLSTIRTDLSVAEYDAVGYYDYEAGESIHVVCERDVNAGFGVLNYKLNFYRSKDTTVVSKYDNQRISFDTVLKSEHHNGYWECIFGNYIKKDRTVLRIYLRLQTSIDSLIPKFTIILSVCVVIAIAMMMVYWKFRKHKRDFNATDEYVNLSINAFTVRPNHTDRHEYAEILDRKDSSSDAYAVIYDKTDCLYTTPIPKSQRNKNTCAYSNIYHKNSKGRGDLQRNEKLASIEEDVAYAEVMPKSENENSSKRYANVSGSDRYVNADANEYAEPAYCQAIIKN